MEGAGLQIPGFQASSAGTRAVLAHPIHEDAAAVLKDLGGDSSNFAARQLNAKIAMHADLILTMTRAHRDRVLEVAPRLLRKVYTLTEAAAIAADSDARTIADLAALRTRLTAGSVTDVPDPIGQTREVFAQVGSQIASLLPPVLELCRRTAVDGS